MTDFNKYDDHYLNPLNYEDAYSMLGGMMTQAFSSSHKNGHKNKENKQDKCNCVSAACGQNERRQTVNTELSPRPKARNISLFPFAFLRGR